jgi:hypothetical protein
MAYKEQINQSAPSTNSYNHQGGYEQQPPYQPNGYQMAQHYPEPVRPQPQINNDDYETFKRYLNFTNKLVADGIVAVGAPTSTYSHIEDEEEDEKKSAVVATCIIFGFILLAAVI